VILRCTAKLLSLLRSTKASVAAPPSAATDWYANLLWFERRKCLLVTHSGTLFSIFVPDVSVVQFRPIGRLVVPLIKEALLTEELPPDTFGVLKPDDVVIARTADRSVLGSMNDMALMLEWRIAARGGLKSCDVVQLNRQLRQEMSATRGYVTPLELAQRWQRLG